MSVVHAVTVLFLLAAAFLYFAVLQEKQNVQKLSFRRDYAAWAFFAAVLLIKLWLATRYRGFDTDINCFNAWSSRAFSGGLGSFYTDGFCDYPPGYIYVLYAVGALRHLFGTTLYSGADLILLKLPAILCDMGAGILLYRIAAKKASRLSALALSALYMLSPAVVINSSTWGQVDGILAFGLALSFYLATEKKVHLAYIVFVISILLKLQAIMFTPVLIFATVAEIWLPRFDAKRLGKLAAWFAGSVAIFFLLCVPFGVKTILEQLLNTLSSYPYASVNAFNTYTLFGLNWKHLEEMPVLRTWGTVAIFLLVAFAAFLFYRTDICRKKVEHRDPSRYYFIGAAIIFCMFVLSTKMHERYLFPALLLLLMAYASRPVPANFILYLVLTVTQTYNTAYVLFYYDAGTYYQTIDRFYAYARPVAIATLLAFLYFLYVAYKEYIKTPKVVHPKQKKRKQ